MILLATYQITLGGKANRDNIEFIRENLNSF
jgi:hypothetical protein